MPLLHILAFKSETPKNAKYNDFSRFSFAVFHFANSLQCYVLSPCCALHLDERAPNPTQTSTCLIGVCQYINLKANPLVFPPWCCEIRTEIPNYIQNTKVTEVEQKFVHLLFLVVVVFHIVVVVVVIIVIAAILKFSTTAGCCCCCWKNAILYVIWLTASAG